MAEQPYFDIERGEAVVPWRVAFPRWAAYAFAGVFWVLIILGAVLAKWPVATIAIIAFCLIFPFPKFVNRWMERRMAPEPLGIGQDEMVGVTTVGGAGHVQWAEVAEVKLQGLSSEGGEPTRHLLVRLKDGGGARFDLPPMSEDEFGQLWAVLEAVAGRHGFVVRGI